MENKNQPAYPFNEFVNEGNKHRLGLTKREYFAAMADIPWNAVIETLRIEGNNTPTIKKVIEYRAQMKIIEADELLKQLENGK